MNGMKTIAEATPDIYDHHQVSVATIEHFRAEHRQAVGLRRDPRDEPAGDQPCSACGRAFTLPAGLVTFSTCAGLALPTTCRRCRPTRRAVLAGAQW
jgi:hypothetical protein